MKNAAKVESDTPPSERPSGVNLQEGDRWHPPSGERYVWSGDAWEPIIDGLAGSDAETLSKRERFAMAAMQGILGKQAGAGDQLGDLTTRNMDKVAEASTQFADALLAELEKTEES